MTILSVLRKTRDILSDPAKWCQGAYRRNAAGEKCDATEAVSFCLLGATFEAADELGDPRLGCDARERLRCRVSDGRLVEWNDDPDRTHTDVLELLDATIAGCPE